MVKKTLFLVLTLALFASMTSCDKAVEKARQNIRVEAIEKIERQGLTGIDAVVRVKNGTGYKLVLDAAEVDVFYGNSRVATVTLREGVEVQRHTTASIASHWDVKINNPLTLLVFASQLRAGDISQISLSFVVEGRGGPAPINISQERVPLSDFLNTFGLTMQDLKKYI